MSSKDRPLQLDKLHAIGARELATNSHLTIHVLQRKKPAQIVSALATTFVLICKRYSVDPRNVLDATDKMIRNAQDRTPVPMRALARWMREDLPDA